MASFIAKQVVGRKLDSVKEVLNDKDDRDGRNTFGEVNDSDALEVRKEEEEKRKQKHRKKEDDREKLRQDIREKYGLKKGEMISNQNSEIKSRKKSASDLSSGSNGDDEICKGSVLLKNQDERSTNITKCSTTQNPAKKCTLQ